MTRRLATLIVLSMVSALGAQEPSAAPSAPQDGSLLKRFLAREIETVTHYRATRRLEAENGRFNVKGWMEVVTELSPERGFTWTVVSEGGSGYIRNKVLRRTLEGEAESLRASDSTKSAFNETNYTFAVPGAGPAPAKADAAVVVADSPATEGLAKLLITPKRKDMLLVNGALFLDGDDADLIQVEGRISKSPSFWTKSVDMMRRYARINGIRVPVITEYKGSMRIAGRSEFRMTYDYQMINGKEITER